MNEAIKLAIEEGGYKPDLQETPTSYRRCNYQIVLDPLFWQALGRALGWAETNTKPPWHFQPIWKDYAHEYFDLVLTGGDVVGFWNQFFIERGAV